MKLLLDQTYIYNGKFYGPGETEVADADAAKAIQALQDAAKQQHAAQQQNADAAPAADEPTATTERKR